MNWVRSSLTQAVWTPMPTSLTRGTISSSKALSQLSIIPALMVYMRSWPIIVFALVVVIGLTVGGLIFSGAGIPNMFSASFSVDTTNEDWPPPAPGPRPGRTY